jgi:hypothetical protein
MLLRRVHLTCYVMVGERDLSFKTGRRDWKREWLGGSEGPGSDVQLVGKAGLTIRSLIALFIPF